MEKLLNDASVKCAMRDSRQGLTLAQLSAQRKRFEWDKGYLGGVCLGSLQGAGGGGFRRLVGDVLCQNRLKLNSEVDECKPLIRVCRCSARRGSGQRSP